MKRICIIFAATLLSINVSAARQWCTGTLMNTYLQNDGSLIVRGTWRGQHTTLCNVNQDRLGISTEVCKGWMSMSLAAKLSKAEVVVYYSDVSSCTEIPAYSSAPAPVYFMLNE